MGDAVYGARCGGDNQLWAGWIAHINDRDPCISTGDVGIAAGDLDIPSLQVTWELVGTNLGDGRIGADVHDVENRDRVLSRCTRIHRVAIEGVDQVVLLRDRNRVDTFR